MGVLVQREFTVGADDRTEFERQSRLGVWENAALTCAPCATTVPR